MKLWLAKFLMVVSPLLFADHLPTTVNNPPRPVAPDVINTITPEQLAQLEYLISLLETELGEVRVDYDNEKNFTAPGLHTSLNRRADKMLGVAAGKDSQGKINPNSLKSTLEGIRANPVIVKRTESSTNPYFIQDAFTYRTIFLPKDNDKDVQAGLAKACKETEEKWSTQLRELFGPKFSEVRCAAVGPDTTMSTNSSIFVRTMNCSIRMNIPKGYKVAETVVSTDKFSNPGNPTRDTTFADVSFQQEQMKRIQNQLSQSPDTFIGIKFGASYDPSTSSGWLTWKSENYTVLTLVKLPPGTP